MEGKEPLDRHPGNVGPAADDGFWLTDTETGKRRLMVSIREMIERSRPPVVIDDPSRWEIYGFHSKFNPQSNRLMLSLRWFPAQDRPRWNLFASAFNEVRYAWVTMAPGGTVTSPRAAWGLMEPVPNAPLPWKGTCSVSTPARALNTAVIRCCEPPVPEEAKL